MKLIDKAEVFARIIDTRMGEDRIRAAVIARPTFRVEGGALVPTPDEPWPVSTLPIATACGLLPGDTPFLSGGIDVLLGGTVDAPSGSPREPLSVDLRVGSSFRRRFLVPLDARGEEYCRLDAPGHFGRGYHPPGPDRFPGCAAHLDLGIAGRSALERISPLAFNQAHPTMIVAFEEAPRPGQIVALTHGLPGGEDLRFAMPELALHAHIQASGERAIRGLRLDQIGLVAGEARVFFSLRTAFEYRLVPGERPSITLHIGPAPEVHGTGVEDDWDLDWDLE